MSLVFKTLVIVNFKSFLGVHEFNLKRPPGLYYISGRNKLNPELGPNGVGKTSLWDALEWVLFGSTGRDNRPAAAVVPWGLEEGTTKVGLIFSVHKKTYELVRSRRPNALTLNLIDNEPKVVEQYQVERRLGLSAEMFKRTIVLAQFGTFFLDLRPEQQSQMFTEALNLDVWLNASKLAGKAHKGFSSEFAALMMKASQQDGRLQELENSLAREEKAEGAYISKIREELTELDKRIGVRNTQLETLLAAYRRPREGAGPGPRGRAANRVAGKGLKLAGGALGTAGKGVKGLAKALGADIATGEVALRATGRERAALAGLLLGLERALADCKADVRLYENALAKDKMCPECGQSVSASHLKDKRKEATLKVEKLSAEHKVNSKELADYDKAIEERVAALNTYSSMLAKFKDTQALLDVMFQQREALENRDNPHTETIKVIKARIKKLKATKKEEETELVNLEKQLGVCSYWIDAFKEIRLNLIDSVLSELEIAVTQHAENLGLVDWRIEFQTERVKTSGEVTTAFSILLYPPDQDEPVKFESYSGGESQRWQLATAFGLSEIILARMGITPNIEVLDEPTKGLSPEGIDDLLEHLADRAKALGRAIYVTEHHSLERGLFNQVITVQRDKKGSSIREDV